MSKPRAGDAQPGAAEYDAAVLEAVGAGDWLCVVELLAEVKLLKFRLPDTTVMAASRALCEGGQWGRGAGLLEDAILAGASCDDATLRSVIGACDAAATAVGDASTATRAAKAATGILDAVASTDDEAEAPGWARNAVARLLARAGDYDGAEAALDALMREEVAVEGRTFTVIAAELLRAGEGDRAEVVLECRDYL
ncbi:unnamed protein product [Pedinophyceae sp. YPF-701]|nr:unnamed protein product [Pedinophyceae sp. YPF-701]